MGEFICAALAPAKPSPAVTNNAIISLDISFPYDSSTLSHAPIEGLRPCLLQAHVVLDGLDAADGARDLNRLAFRGL